MKKVNSFCKKLTRVEKHFNFSKHFASTGSQLGNSEWSMPSISNSAQRTWKRQKGIFRFKKPVIARDRETENTIG